MRPSIPVATFALITLALPPTAWSTPTDGGGGRPLPSTCSPGRGMETGDRTFAFEGLERAYRLSLPQGYNGRRAVPLVLNLHGHNGSKEKHDAATEMSVKAGMRGYAVVTPDSQPPNWNVREEPGRAHDFAYIDALMTHLTATLCVDPDRIYVVGHSNGSAFAGLLACRAPYRFAAAVLVSGTPPLSCPHEVAPPTMFIRGTADRTVPYEGGVLGGAVSATARYAAAYGCAAEPARAVLAEGVEQQRYDGCRGGGEVVLDTVVGGAHVWPGGPKAQDMPGESEAGRRFPATEAALDFFGRHVGRPWARP